MFHNIKPRDGLGKGGNRAELPPKEQAFPTGIWRVGVKQTGLHASVMVCCCVVLFWDKHPPVGLARGEAEGTASRAFLQGLLLVEGILHGGDSRLSPVLGF